MDQQFRQVEAQENQSSVSAASYRGEVASQGQVGGAFEEGFDSPSIVSPLKSVPKPMRVLGYLVLGYGTLALSFYAFSESALNGAEKNLGVINGAAIDFNRAASPEAKKYQEVFDSFGSNWAANNGPRFDNDSIPSLDYRSAGAFKLACEDQIKTDAAFAAMRSQLGTPTDRPLQFGTDYKVYAAGDYRAISNWRKASYIFDIHAMAEAGRGHPLRALKSAENALAFADQLSGMRAMDAQTTAAVSQRYAYSMFAGILSMYGNREDVRTEILAHIKPTQDLSLSSIQYQQTLSFLHDVGDGKEAGKLSNILPQQWLGLSNFVPGIRQWQKAHFLDLSADDYRVIQAAETQPTVTDQLAKYVEGAIHDGTNGQNALLQPLGEALKARFERDDWAAGLSFVTRLLSRVQPGMNNSDIGSLVSRYFSTPQEHMFQMGVGAVSSPGYSYSYIGFYGEVNQTLFGYSRQIGKAAPLGDPFQSQVYSDFHIDLPETLWQKEAKPR